MPKHIKMYRRGELTILKEVIAAIPPDKKIIRANIKCHGTILPGKKPTPEIPIPSKPSGIVDKYFLNTF